MSFLRKGAIALGATAAIAGGAAAYVYFNGVPGGGGGEGLYGSAEIVPDEAMAAVAILNNRQAWENLSNFGSSQTQEQANTALQGFKQQTLEDTGLSLDDDILPLLDGIVIAMLPPTDVDSADAPELLTVLSTTNPIKALALLTKAKDGADVEIKMTDHKGVQISELTKPDGGQFFSAVVSQRLVLSPARRPVEMAIEASQGDGSLADLPKAASAFRGDSDSLARLYVPDYGELISQVIALSPNSAPISPEALAQLDKVEGIVAGLAVEEEGIRIKATSQVDASLRPDNYQASPSEAVERFPAETVAFFTGQGVSQSWAKMTEQSASLPESAQMFELMRNASQQVDIDLDQDVFGWMTGEVAFGIVPVNEGLVGQVGMGAVMVMDSGDRPATEALLTKLDGIASGNQLKVNQKNIGKQAITAWQSPLFGGDEALVGRGWLDDNSLFVAMGDRLVNNMVEAPQQALPSSPVFQSVMEGLPEKNVGYGYVNVEQALALASNSPLGSQLDPQAMDILAMVEGIGMATTWEKADSSEMELFVALKSTAELESAAQ